MNDRERYNAALHAMQSGVLMEIDAELPTLHPDLKRFLKHQRVGINSALSDIGALARLLIARGLFTEAEYLAAVADAMEAEQKTYEATLSQLLGVKVSLA